MVISGLLLGACGLTQEARQPVTPDTVAPLSVAQKTQDAQALEQTAITQHEAMLQPEPEPEPLIAVPQPDSLLGQPSSHLLKILGEPSFVRRDPPAELWQYKTSSCIVDFFLYEDDAQQFTVKHLEFRQALQTPQAFENCLRVIITRAIDTGEIERS